MTRNEIVEKMYSLKMNFPKLDARDIVCRLQSEVIEAWPSVRERRKSLRLIEEVVYEK